jgi:starvation-inducible DNA-binding protein
MSHDRSISEFADTRVAAKEISPNGAALIGTSLRSLLADAFALYLKTKNFHWHMSGPSFRSYHLLLDEQGEQIFAMTDPIAERARKLGTPALHSIGEIGRLQRLRDNDNCDVSPAKMISELCADNRAFTSSMRDAHLLCDEHSDVATASLLENWIDEAEGRCWFLSELLTAK